MRAREKAVLCLVVLGVALLSCRQVVGIADPDPPLRCDAPESTLPSCRACLVGQCCAELATCQADEACRTLRTCVAACSDDACRATCESKTKLGETAAAVYACEASRCDVDCGLPCGGAGLPFAGCAPAGGSCAATCCSEGKAFRADVAGQHLRACRAACGSNDFACRETCANRHEEGADLEQAARECVSRACSLQGDWSCIGQVESVKGSAAVLNVRVYVRDLETLLPLSGVTVKGCSVSDITCQTPPHGTATTGTKGFAELSVTLAPAAGIDAYPGFIELQRSDYPPVLAYFLPPITTNTVFDIAIFSRKSLENLAGGVLSTDRGMVTFGALDCRMRPAPGVSFRASTSDARTRRFYATKASTSASLLDFQANVTTDLGYGGFFDVPTGRVTVTSRVEHLCVDSASAEVGVRAGAITNVYLPPSPAR